jgi:hypothetical protein
LEVDVNILICILLPGFRIVRARFGNTLTVKEPSMYTFLGGECAGREATEYGCEREELRALAEVAADGSKLELWWCRQDRAVREGRSHVEVWVSREVAMLEVTVPRERK